MPARGALPFALALAALPATAGAQTPYPHADEPIGTVREIYDGVLSPEMAANTFRNIDRLFPSRRIPASTRPRPLPAADEPFPTITIDDDGERYGLEEFLELNRVSGLLVLHHGRIELERYRLGNTERTRWMSMSVAKSVTSTLFGAALHDGHIMSLEDPVAGYVPELMGTAYHGVSVRDVLMMSSGVRWRETYTDPTSDRRALLEAQIARRPGGAVEVMRHLSRAAEPGTVNRYSTGETQIAGEVLYRALGGPLSDYLHEQIWEPYGMEADATWWLESPDGVENRRKRLQRRAAGLRPPRAVHPGRRSDRRRAGAARRVGGGGRVAQGPRRGRGAGLRLLVVDRYERGWTPRRRLLRRGHPRPVPLHQSRRGRGHRPLERPSPAHGRARGRRVGVLLGGKRGAAGKLTRRAIASSHQRHEIRARAAATGLPRHYAQRLTYDRDVIHMSHELHNMSIVRTSPKGQVVVPAELRKEIGLEPGDLVMVTHAGGRRVLIEPVGDDPIDAARGLLAEGPSLTEALEEEHRTDDARSQEKAARFVGGAGPSQRRTRRRRRR